MEYIFTERAHLMCPNMNFGIAEVISKAFDADRIKEVILKLADAHPFLRALLGYQEESNAFYYDITDNCKADILIAEEEVSEIDDPKVMAEYERLVSYDWNLFEECMLKATAWKMRDKTCILLVFHHLLADGRGALGLAKELADCYVEGTEPKFAPERLISSKEDFPKESEMPFVSRLLVNKANKDWAKENKKVAYKEYHEFAKEFLKNDSVKHTIDRVDRAAVKVITDNCHDNGVSVNDYLVAKMFVEDDTDKIIIASDLRERLSFYTPGAMGNYATAFSIALKKKDSDLFPVAKKVHKLVQKKLKKPSNLYLVLQCYANLDAGIIDAAVISCRGNFKSKTGKFVGSVFFGLDDSKGYSITNLGRIESRNMESACFIPPASPAIKKIQGVLTVNGEMIICTSER